MKTRRSRSRMGQFLAVPTLAVAILLVSSFAPTTAPVGAPSAAEAVTGYSVNFSGYCKRHYNVYGSTTSATHAWTGAWTLTTWRCTVSSFFQVLSNPARLGPRIPFGRCASCRVVTRDSNYSIDVNAVCRWQYGGAARAYYVGQSWSDWRCRLR